MKNETLQDLISDCPCDHNKWCFLREIIKHTGLGDDAAEQIRLVYTHKFLMSLQAGRDVGEQAAWESWIADGFAKRYREIYKDGMKHEELKYKMFIEKRGETQ
jgi:hypothetical protein